MNLIRTAAKVHGWHLNLGEIARIWKGGKKQHGAQLMLLVAASLVVSLIPCYLLCCCLSGCIIRAVFLDRIKAAYDRSGDLNNLMIDPEFAAEMNERHMSLRAVVATAISKGVSVGAFSASLFYYDSYRRARLPANLTQAQRDFFGAHTYQRVDKEGVFHTEWEQQNKQ